MLTSKDWLWHAGAPLVGAGQAAATMEGRAGACGANMPLGEALGLSALGGLMIARANTSLRVLALVPDTLGGSGGIAEYNRHFLSSLAASDCVSEVVVLPRWGALAATTLPDRLRQLRPRRGRLAYSLSVCRAALAEPRFDLVVCGHGYMAPLAALFAWLLRAKLWIQLHGVEAWQPTSWLQRRSMRQATLLTAVSRHTRRRVLAWLSVDPHNIRVLPNTVDPRFTPGPKPRYLAERHGLEERKVLLTVSRLAAAERYKGHDRVIQALPKVLGRHPDAVYVIVGDGDDRARLEALAEVCRRWRRRALCWAGCGPGVGGLLPACRCFRHAKHRGGVRYCFS